MRVASIFNFLIALVSVVIAQSEYKVIQKTLTSTSVSLELQYFGKEEYYLKPSSPIVNKLKFVFQCLSSGEFSIKITDKEQQRFQVLKGDPFPQDQKENFTFPLEHCGVILSYHESPFDFQIRKTEGGSVIFSTAKGDFIYSNYFIQISTELPSDKWYGLGERFGLNLRKGEGKWTVFNKAGDQVIDRGTGNNTYGYYPFYLSIDNQNQAHINYLKTTNAIDVIKSQSEGKHYLTFKLTGGVVHFRFLLQSKGVVDLLRNFQLTCVGKPAIPPFWSLGFHQSRWGYDSVQALKKTIDGYQSYGIPLDTIWSDIDYMDEFKDFTVDTQNFPLDQMNIITKSYRYIPIVDAGVATGTEGYDAGHSRDVFMKDLKGREFVGKVWPGDTTFVDFLHPKANQYWAEMLESLNAKLNFSGIWLDMNEIEQFCDGPCEIINQTAIIDFSEDLPYQPGSEGIETGTVPLNLTHFGNVSEFNVHPYFGLLESYATNLYLKQKTKFPFILSRSTTFGSSRYTFHWTGDNHASWEFLRSSIVDNMNVNMAGIQMVGPDICGFGGDTTEELCSRWYQLAAVYPFARSHNDYWSIPQEPFSLGDRVLRIAFSSIKLRYVFLAQYYSDWIMDGGLSPFFTSPALYPQTLQNVADPELFDEIVSTQFFILNQPLMVAPILEEGKSSRRVFFPDYSCVNPEKTKSSLFFDVYTGLKYEPRTFRTIDNNIPDQNVPMFLVAGHSILIKNVSIVTQTTHYDNNYVLVSAFELIKTEGDIATFSSSGQILAISRFTDENFVEESLRGKDRYEFQLTLKTNVKGSLANLTIQAVYKGGTVRQKVTLSQIFYYFDNDILSYSFPSMVEVEGNVTVVFPIDLTMKDRSNPWTSILGNLPSSKAGGLRSE